MVKYSHTKSVIKKYSRDRSVYKVDPLAVVFPQSEHAVSETVLFAKEHGLCITGRGGGTGLSGAAINKGIIIDFTKHFNHIAKIGPTTVAGSGTLLKVLTPHVQKAGYMFPSVPWHGDCAIGGCVNTRSIGARVLKYGAMDKQVKSVRGVTADGWVLDTAKTIPKELAKQIKDLQREIKQNKALVTYLKKRPPVAGGYNLKAFLEETNINKLTTQLIVGSVGTLLLMTEVRLALPKYKPTESVFLIHFNDIESMQPMLDSLLRKKPVSIQYFGEELVSTWKGTEYYFKDSIGAFIAIFEEEGVDISRIAKPALAWREVVGKEQPRLWNIRAKALPTLEHQARKIGMQLPSGIDDTTIHPKDFAQVIKEVKAYAKRAKVPIAAFGHAGIGSIHLRPFIDMKRTPQKLDKVGENIFRIVAKYGGTLVGEHNAGRCRSRYLEMESRLMYRYMKKLKDIFDPHDVLNPNIMFDVPPITEHIKV